MMSVQIPQRLAREGGAPVRTQPFPPWPVFGEDERAAVDAVLASGRANYWAGSECRAFEDEYAAYVGAPHAIALANGTVALELALHGLGVGPGDEVIVPARTFIASASCAVMRGARPVVADVDPVSQNLTAATVRTALTPRTRAIVAVHLAGWPCEMEGLAALARERGLFLIEDCAQAHGARFRGAPVGSFGDCAAFSFCQDKIISTGGEGGMLVVRDRAVWERAWAYKDHGKNREAACTKASPVRFRWLHESFGTNWRLTEMQAAIGRRQLAKLDDWVARRRANAAVLDARLAQIPGIRVLRPPEHVRHAYYKYYALLDESALKRGWDRDRVIESVIAEGVPCLAGACPDIAREHAFEHVGWSQPAHPGADSIAGATLMLLVHPTASEADMEQAAGALGKVMREATS